MGYFNNASQTPVKPEVIDVITNVLKNNWHNPSDIFMGGIDAKNLIENAREIIAQSINAEPEEIIFCSSGSAANSLGISGYINSFPRNESVLITSNVEHNSILNNPCLKHKVKVDQNGFVTPIALEDAFHQYEDNVIVSIMAANNEIGTINDIRALATVAHNHDAVFHTDLTQYYPHYKVDVKEIGIDMATISFHKLGCCAGIAVLYKRNGIPLKPIVFGEQESGLNGGTECTPLICGAAKAVELLDYSSTAKIEKLRDVLYKDLVDNFGSDFILNGVSINSGKRLCNNINIRINGIRDNQQLLAMLDMEGVYCSAGSSCNSYNPEPSRVLKAIGLTDEQCYESIRISLGEQNTEEEIHNFVRILSGCVELLR